GRLGGAPPRGGRVRARGGGDTARPDAPGGAGASLLDAALVAEQAGAALAPVPLVESIVATRLLARLDSPAAASALAAALAGDAIITIPLHAPDNAGTARWVPWGAVAHPVLRPDPNPLPLPPPPP